MAIIDLDEIKEQLRIDFDDDDDILQRKLDAAQNHLERLLGYKIETEYPPTAGNPPASTVPPALRECVCQLAGHWYENREATIPDAVQVMPISVDDVVREFRNWSWAG